MNTNRLKAKMKEYGDTQMELGIDMGRNISTINAKINGSVEFTVSEAKFIIDRYKLTSDEVKSIFFD